MLRKIARPFLRHLKLYERAAHLATETPVALRRIVSRGIDVNTVIDIGASNGSWSGEVMPLFPNARYLLIEAQEIHRPSLQRFVQQHPNASLVLKAAGSKSGFIYFSADTPFGGQASEQPQNGETAKVPLTTIDDEVLARALPGPYLLKFDVHGFEMPILEGAKRTLPQASLVVMECYNFEIAPGAVLFYDMCRKMHDLGFRVIDISEPLWRIRDRAFWQIDFFFVSVDRPEFQVKTYL